MVSMPTLLVAWLSLKLLNIFTAAHTASPIHIYHSTFQSLRIYASPYLLLSLHWKRRVKDWEKTTYNAASETDLEV
ncbi:hypothetical protein ASPVEDRAFT_37329 [Aspergillus versicolor CBS 583.65]|uniref:Secreted protein n=1 Tax=Aspergillus versicolor CBS 583.65 TaxID=1036611 RepID=A0A1L9P8Q7_ASPVE|nr:uncharacterized protein ASPVEDRAFT_37329 [Aspergillus versicolor CBS 583.65]OJI97878.1 hypothetical protein ASPVEDRAFT_37329 [Aspergillus versicolor CBS 583.65]